MTVRVVTDSTADLPRQVAEELGIAVVPLHIHFGEETFQDGVSISTEGFYNLLTTGDILPKTSAPSSGMFIETYEQLAQETDEIVSIHISTKLSATHASAMVAREGVETPCRIEVVDSLSASIGLGLQVVRAAEMARAGASLDDIVEDACSTVQRTQLFGVVDTLEYLHKGGRIGRAATYLGSVLNVKPIIGVREGIVHPIERVRGRERALDRICEMVAGFHSIASLAVAHTTTEDEMEQLASRLSQFYPGDDILRTRCGATLGTYLGPGTLCVALIEG
ncbi:MAG: DegV family protein [Chloroflexi bacterium]|jgi:DegV family protein with EDD domain|nr:DegV family protein [Chloroflexota bacterium]